MNKFIVILSTIFSLISCSAEKSPNQASYRLPDISRDIQSPPDVPIMEDGTVSDEIDAFATGKDSEANKEAREPDVPQASDANDASDAQPPHDSFDPAPEDAPVPEPELICPEGSEPIDGDAASDMGYSFTTPQNLNYNFECNLCPGGREELDGLYRYYTPLNAEGECIASNCCKPNEDCGTNGAQNETFLFEGNQWTRVTNVIGPPPGVYGGFYFCPEAKALSKFKEPSQWTEIFVFETLPSQSQLKPGYSNPCHIKASGANGIFFECNPQWNTSLPVYYDLEFCKVGTIVDGIPCTDPFE